MSQEVMLSIRGRQAYIGQEPDVIELVTEGVMSYSDGVWKIQYEESDLTGMAGVTTTFYVKPESITLRRTGQLRSEMVFQTGKTHESLYELPFGTFMLSVCATQIAVRLDDRGGMIDLVYNIDIEHNAAGTVDYHLEITPK